MTLLVKICGLSTRETLDAALEAGADMVGFVFFPPSPRHLSLDTARELAGQVKQRATKVVLTVDADDATLEGIVEALAPDILQLHGHETPARVSGIKRKFGREVMKALPVERASDLATLPDYAGVADRILFDARPPKGATRPGGLGAAFDWQLLKNLDIKLPFMVSRRPSCRQCRRGRPCHPRRGRRCSLGRRARARRQGCRDNSRFHPRGACKRRVDRPMNQARPNSFRSGPDERGTSAFSAAASSRKP